MSELRIAYNLEREKWDNFIYGHPNGNIFQTPEMFEVYKNTKNLKPILLAVINNNEDIVGVLLAVIQKESAGWLGNLTARSVVWGGPLIISTDKKIEILELMLRELDEILKKQVIYIQFRNLWEFSQEKNCFIKNGYIYEDHLDYHIDLTFSEEELLNQMSDSRRKNIKKALHGDLQTKEACDCGGIEIFYGLLKNTYGRIKMPCPSLDFFMNAFRFLQGKGRVNFFLTSYKGKNIAGRAVLVYKGVIYDWYAGSSKEALSYYANELIIWQIILWGKKKGYKVFDFGGAGSPATYYGPAEFKRRFGGREVNFGRFEKAYNKKIHWLIKKYSRLSLKKL